MPRNALPSVNTDADTNRVLLEASAAAKGDRRAFEVLVNQFHQDIFRMVYFRTGSRTDAEDLSQDIFLQAFNSVHRLRDPAKFRSWLFRIGVNRVKDFRRKKRIRSALGLESESDEKLNPPDDQSPHALDELMKKEFWNQVHGFLKTLSRWEREIFTLRFLDGLGIKEISLALKKSESTVKTNLYRAVNKFRIASKNMDYLKEVSV